MTMPKLKYVLIGLCIYAGISLCPDVAHAADEPDVRYGEIVNLAEEGDYSTAARELRSFIRANPGYEDIEEARVRYGELLLEAGDVAAAYEQLMRLLPEADDFEGETLAARVRFSLGRAYEAMGKYPFAMLGYEGVLASHPESEVAPEAALKGGWVARNLLGNRRRAREHYEMFVREFPDHRRHPEILNLLARMIEKGAGDEGFQMEVEEHAEGELSSDDQLFLKHIGTLPDRADDAEWGVEPAVEMYERLANQYPDYPGNEDVVDRSTAGAARGLWHAVDLARKQLNDEQKAVEILDDYLELPGADREEGFWLKARLLRELDRTDEAVKALQNVIATDPAGRRRREVARQLEELGEEDEARNVLLEVVKTSDDWDVARKALGDLPAGLVDEYLDDHPGDYHVLRYRLEKYADGDDLEGGREILNEWLERDDIDWKTAIAADWYGWTGERQDAQAALRMAEQEGLIRKIGEFALASADMPAVRKAAERVDELEEREAEIQDGDMEGDERQKQLDEINEEKEQLADRREEARALLERVIREWGSYPDFPLDVPLTYDFENGTTQGWVNDSGNFEVVPSPSRGSYAAGEESDNQSVNISHLSPPELSGGRQPDSVEFYWQETNKSHGGGMLLEDSSGDEVISFASDNPEWYIRDKNGENQVYGGDGYDRWVHVKISFDWSSGTADVYVRDLSSGHSDTYSDRPLINNTDIETLRVKNYNRGWSNSNFHMWFDDITVLGGASLFDALRETVDGTGQVAELIVDENCDEDPRVLGMLAEMRRENDHDAALETTRRAAEELIEAGEFDAAAGHLEASLEGMPGDAADAADLLFSAASAGTRDEWGAAWEDLIVEASSAGYEAVQDRLKRAREAAEKREEAERREEKNDEKDEEDGEEDGDEGEQGDGEKGKPEQENEDEEKQDEPDWKDDLLAGEELAELRYRAVLFARPLKPQRTIEAADRFMDEHEDSSRGAQVARERFRAMQRADVEDFRDRITEAIERIADDPAAIRNIPPELVHGGPGGIKVFEEHVTEVIESEDQNLRDYARKALMECYEERGRPADAIGVAREIRQETDDDELVQQAERTIERIMDEGYFPPGLDEEDARTAYRTRFRRALESGAGTSFADYAGVLWRLSSHPAYQLRGFESFDRLYLYSTHRNVEKAGNINEFAGSMYQSWPGDGVGPSRVPDPDGELDKNASPYAGGDDFMMMWWGVFRAPEDGKYRFWGDVDDWVGLELSGREINFPAGRNGAFSKEIALNRGLHLIRIPYGDWGGNYDVRVDWQPPGGKRRRMGPEAFSAERYPLILSRAAANRRAGGMEQWQEYAETFDGDRRGQMLRLQTLIMADPEAALDELQDLRDQFPHNPFYRERYADCLWRLGRTEESLEHYEALAEMPDRRSVSEQPEASATGIYRRVFLRGEDPISYEEEFEDRIRDAGDRERWLGRAEREGGLDEKLRAMHGAAMTLRSLEGQVEMAESIDKRLNAAISREESALKSARELAEDEDTDEDTREEARKEVEKVRPKLDTFKGRVAEAEENVERTSGQAEELRQALGLEEDDEPWVVYYEPALDALSSGAVSMGTIKILAQDLWDAGERGEKVKPLLEAILARSSDRWAVDRLVDMAMEEDDPHAALDVLVRAGHRNPGKADHARRYLRRICNVALDHGRVLDFARTAHLLADKHPERDKLAGFLPRLGEVFENAGNYRSAEREYRRVMERGDEERTVEATLSLAEMFYGLQRPEEALSALSELVDVYVPGEDEEEPPGAAERYEQEDAEGEGDGEDADEKKGEDEDEDEAEDEETEGEETPDVERENTRALLLASRCYIELERPDLAYDAYRRAEQQPDFGEDTVPEWDYLMDLARSIGEVEAGRALDGDEEIEERDVPPELMQRAEDVLDIADRIFEFYADDMKTEQSVKTLLLRADASMLTRNYPQAVEEIRQAREKADDNPVRHLASLKMGEVHLATDSVQEAISTFERLVEVDRKEVSAQALFLLGTTRLTRGERDKAVDAFRRLWERYAGSEMVREAVYKIARTYADEGAFLEAIRLYEAVGAIDSSPRDTVVPGDSIMIKVEDADHFISTGRTSMDVTVTAASGDEEVLKLDMNPINRSLFMNPIRTELGEAEPNDGKLQVRGDDAVYVTYTDRFRASDDEAGGPLDHVRTIHVVDNGEIQVSPTRFVEVDEDEVIDEEEMGEEEAREKERMRSLMPRIESGRAVLRPGNDMFIRVEDRALSLTSERDTAKVQVFTYMPKDREVKSRGAQQGDQDEIRERLRQPPELNGSDELPDNPRPSTREWDAPLYGDNHRKINTTTVEVTETEPNSGIFYGSVNTARSGPTAIAGEVLGDNEAARAIDGRNTADSAWRPMGDGRPGKWIEIDLKELRDVSRIVWHRGEGAEDRYMRDYTVTLTGEGVPETIEVTDNDSPQDNEIDLEEPVSARWIRLMADRYEGDAPAIAQVEIYNSDGERLVPQDGGEEEDREETVLELEVGDYIGAQYEDERNADPGRMATRTSNGMNTAFTDGYVDAASISIGENEVGGNHIDRIAREEGDGYRHVYGRRTKRITPDGELDFIVVDADLNVNERLNSGVVELHSTTGDMIEAEVQQIGAESDIFSGTVEVSGDEEEGKDDGVLYARPGDFVALRYRDEENINPGHSVVRSAHVMVRGPELARFPETMVQLTTPTPDEDEEEETARLEVKLLAPDQAVPDVDSVQVEALSFSTRDRVRFNLPMQDLDGLFGATIPVEIGDRPEVESGDEARRVRSFSERYRRRRHRRRDRDELDIPFAVSGDDVIHLFYEDPLPEQTDDRAVVDVAGVDFLRDLETIHDLEDLPEEAREEGVSVELTDPYTRLNELKGTQRDNVLEEIARQKVHYRRQIERYEEAIAEIDEQIKELEPEEEPEDGGSDEDGDEPPDSPDESVEVPEADAQPDAAEVAGVELADSDRLIRISNLRRRKEGLEEAVEGLRGRAGDLERYDTEEMEKKFEEMFDEASPDAEDGASDETDEADEAAEKEGEEEVEWYEREDWWKECALIPGVSLNVSVRDPDIPDEREKIALEAVVLGSGAPETREFTARRSENDVFEAVIQTHRPGADGDGLSVAGGESLILTYEDEYQDEFSADRSSFVTLASTAEVFATDAEYRAERDSYKLGEDIHVLVQDPDMSKTAVRDYVWVDVESESGGSTSVALRETQRHSGEFRGAVSTRYGESQSNGELRAGFNDEVSITYADELGRKDVDGVSIMERHAVFDPPGDAEVEGFARQLRRGALERDVLFNTARAHFELGKRSLEGGAVQRGRRQLMESRSRLLKLISMYPDEDVAAHGTYYLGNIRFLLGEYEEAVDNFRQVVERWPESEFKGKALFKLGMAHMEADKMDEAIESFVSLAYHHQDSPLVADAMLALSKRFGDEENYQRAIGIGRAFLDKFPDHEKADDTYMRLASWLINEEKHAEAVELLEEAEKEMPESPHMPAFLYWRADCMVKMGDTEKAVVALQRVKYDYPDTRWARYAAARLAEVEE